MTTRLRDRTIRSACLAAIITTFVGCGGSTVDDKPELAQVKGTVTVDSKPVEGAQVMFSPETGAASTAVTGADGTFTLTYSDGTPGAAIGSHRVSITVGGPTPEQQQALDAYANGDRSVEIPKNVPPAKSFQEAAVVKAGENDIPFNLMGR
ncbi:MAG: carboxypeptidase-like regulatory domain-containing protein [Planctomycetaceae bacterium]